MKQKIYHFLEESNTFASKLVNMFIVVLIFVSSGLAILQLIKPDFFGGFTQVIEQAEYWILGIFTVEFLLRLYSTRSQKHFWNSATTWIDLLSIVPFYFGINNSVMLRVFRMFRIFRLSRKGMMQFFDEPKTPIALATRFFIITLIILSSAVA